MVRSLKTAEVGGVVFMWMWHLSLFHKKLLNAKTTRKVHLVKRFYKTVRNVSFVEYH